MPKIIYIAKAKQWVTFRWYLSNIKFCLKIFIFKHILMHNSWHLISTIKKGYWYLSSLIAK